MPLTRSEFFSRVLPPTGYICLIGLMADESSCPIQRFYPLEDIDNGNLDTHIADLLAAGREVYYACATFKDPRGQRTPKNALAYKTFRIDVDCGYGKPYPTQKAGLKALQKYLEDSGLPMPLIVNSGRGWHVYWVLDEPCEYNVWRPIADGFKQSLTELEFITDPTVPADGARILRVPGTYNTKDPKNPLPVEVIADAPPISLQDFKSALSKYIEDEDFENIRLFQTAANTIDDPLMRKLLKSSEKVFSKILKLSLKQEEVVETVEVIEEVNGTPHVKVQKQRVMRSAGCAQIAHIYQNQEDISYDLWRAGLSIARNCTDWEEAIHLISAQDETRYSYEGTVKTAEDTFDKPQLCKTFQQCNPELCLSCRRKGTITTPIVLGFTLTKAEPLDNVHEQVWHQGMGAHTHLEIPIEYPRPWFRPKLGGVALSSFGEDGEEDDTKLIYENDLWVQKILNDPNHGAMLQIARMLPKDGLKEFTIPLAIIYKKEKCAEVLGYHNVAIHPGLIPQLQRYIMDWTKMLQSRAESETSREQFGWHDNDTAFVVGTREYRADGSVVYSPPCSTTEHIAPLYMPKGDVAVWSSIFNTTYGRPGNENRCFVVFASMGAPLYKFFNVNSMLYHLTNSASGVGKTTCQMMGAAVWGDPKKTLLTKNDTSLARQQRFGILNNLPVFTDELTNMAPAETSEFVFTFSSDRGRNRLHSQINVERKNQTSWSTINITSGNNSLGDVLRSHSNSAQGELYRVLENELVKDNEMSKEQSDYYFNHLLRENYGVAGDVLMRYLVVHKDTVVAEALEEQKRFDHEANFAQEARNYSAFCAAAITMGRVAARLGLHNIDVDRVRDWAITTFRDASHQVAQESSADAFSVLGDFLNEHHRNILVVNNRNSATDSALPTAPLKEPYGELLIRYEPNTRRIYIARDKLRSWCSERRVPYTPFIQQLKRLSSGEATARVCLSRGTAIPGSPIWTECFDADALGWHIDTDSYA